MKSFSRNISMAMSAQFLADVLVTIVENRKSWAEALRVTRHGAFGVDRNNYTTALFSFDTKTDEEGGRTGRGIVTLPRLADALLLSITPAFNGLHFRYKAIIFGAILTNDGGEIDSEVADYVLQAALLGEVLYS